MHELAVHFYQGEWASIYKNPQYTYDASARTFRRKRKPAQWSEIRESFYASEDGGPRLMSSVIYARSCHGYAVNETQKPEAVVLPLVEYSVPKGGLLLDPFAGSGTTLAVARKTGRKAIGIEKRPAQCQAIVERLAQHELIMEN
jgi:site-specific DNA-methyltransferase (adenine-specific)